MRGKGKKIKSDTLPGQVKTAQAAVLPMLLPPEHVPLTEEELKFWASIVRARARETWTEPDLELAAMLARDKCALVALGRQLSDEGPTLVNVQGNVVPNPLQTIVTSLRSSVVTMSRLLHIHASATVGRERDTGEKLKHEKRSAGRMPAADTLLAMPVVQ